MTARPEAIKKLLEEDVGADNDYLDLKPKQRTQAKINKWDCNKLKSFCTAKETINKRKRQLMR